MFTPLVMANPSAGGAVSSASGLWDVLRKEARKLESGVDSRLASFSKLGIEKVTLAGDSTDQVVTVKGEEIEALLQRLSDVNDAMSSTVTSTGDARAHTLARHRDILLEFTQEYRRLKNNIAASREHALLLGGSRAGDGNAPLTGIQVQGGSTAQLLRERGYLHSSTSQIDDVIGQAQASLSALAGQRSLLMNMSTKLSDLGAKFPVVNNLVGAIRRKKSKDTIILSAVVASCTLFLLAYWSRS